MAETRTLDFEVTEEGTLLEVQEIVDPKDPCEPVKLRVVEWLGDGWYADLVVASPASPGTPHGTLPGTYAGRPPDHGRRPRP